MKKTRRIFVLYTDPFDDTWLCTSDYHYNKRLSAKGFYTRAVRRMIEGLKKICSDTLEGRTPKATVTIQ